MNKTIDSEIIEKHAIIAGRIYALKEEYVKELKELVRQNNELYRPKLMNDIDKQFYDINTGKIETLMKVIADLEELLK